MWACMALRRRTAKEQKFEIDVLGEEDAKCWSDLFSVPWNTNHLLICEDLRHHKKVAVWRRRIERGSEIAEIFPNFWRCFEGCQTSCVLLNVGLQGVERQPIIVTLFFHCVCSWKSEDVGGKVVIESSIQKISFYTLSVDFHICNFPTSEHENALLHEKVLLENDYSK